MQLDVRSLKTSGQRDGERAQFAGELDLSALTCWGEKPFPEPVRIEGSAACREGFYEIDYTAMFLYRMPCSRCLCPVEERLTMRFEHVAFEREDRDDPEEELLLENGLLDIDAMVVADLLLETQGQVLCAPDCKGICPVCGQNRNETDCGCDTSIPDPRFDILRELMKDED